MRWQYRIVSVDNGTQAGKALAYFGQHGWELITAESFGGWMMFKRPVPNGEQPQGGWSETWTGVNVETAYATLQ